MKSRFFRMIRFFAATERAPQRRTRLRLEALEDRLAPATLNWIGGSGDWNTAANWLDATTQTNHVPVAGDDAVINVAPSITVTHSTGTHTVQSLTTSNPFTLSGGTLSIGATVQVNNAFTLDGGTLSGGTVNFAGGQTLSIVSFNTINTNRLTGVTVNGDLTLSTNFARVIIEGGTTFANAHLSGDLSILSFAPGQTLTGNILFEGASIEKRFVLMFNNTAGTLTIGPTGSIKTVAGFRGSGEIGGPGPEGLFGGEMTLVNQGLISAEASNTTLSVLAESLANTGTMGVDSGSTLRLLGTASWFNTGTLRVAGGTLNLTGTLTTAALNLPSFVRTGGTVLVQGTLNNAGDTLTFNNSTGTWTMSDGTISGGTLSFADGQTLASESSAIKAG